MKLKKVTALLLAGALAASALTGCGDSSASGNAAYTAVGTIDGKDVSYKLANFMAKYQQAAYDTNYYESTEGQFWSQDIYQNGSTMEDMVKDNVIQNLEMLLVLEKNMDKYKVTFEDKDEKAVEKAAKKFMKDNSRKAIKQLGADQEIVEEYLRLTTISNRIFSVVKEEVDKEISDEEAAQRTFTYVTVSKGKSTDEDGKTVEATKEEIAAAKTKAEKFAKTAQTDFDKACKEGELTAAAYSYGKDEGETGEIDEKVTKAADKLKEGEISQVIETESNFYVLRLDSEFDKKATGTKKTELLSKKQDEHFQEIYKELQKEVEFVLNDKAWASIKFDQPFKVVEGKK